MERYGAKCSCTALNRPTPPLMMQLLLESVDIAWEISFSKDYRILTTVIFCSLSQTPRNSSIPPDMSFLLPWHKRRSVLIWRTGPRSVARQKSTHAEKNIQANFHL